MGTVAIVISLAAVAYSIDRNTKELSSASITDLYDSVREIDLIVLADPDLTRIVDFDALSVADLSETDRLRYQWYVVMMLEIWDKTVVRENDGLMEEEAAMLVHQYFGDFVRRYLTKEMWREIRWQWTTPEFLQRVDDALETAG